MKLARFSKFNWGIICSVALGVGAFFWLYSELLNFRYIAWLMNIGGDPFQSYIGWELFRSSPWSFPLGRIINLGYPVGIPIIFTDSIPLLSIFFKLFRQWLPFPFQFIGLWILISFSLQGLFGYLLLEQYFKRRVLAIIGSIFFILSPIMMFRLEGHFSLGAHWLLLWSLWIVLKPTGAIRIWHWTAIMALSVFIHPYLIFMCGALFAVDLIRRVCLIRTLTLKKGLYLLMAEAILTLILSYGIGIFSVGHGTAPGFGVYSLDLNSLINPDGWSTFIQDMRVRKPNEGFNYLGLGIILLGLLSLYEYARSGDYRHWRTTFLSQWPLILISAIFTAIAISHIVSIFGREVIHLPLPNFLRDRVFSIIRSSGRLFWPVYYLIFLGSFSVLKKIRLPLAYGILIGALFLQVYDIHNKLQQTDHFYQNIQWNNPIQAQFWQQAAKQYEHVFFIPTFIYGQSEPIALFAAQHGLTLNTGLVIRDAFIVNKKNMEDEIQRLNAGIVNEKTLYIFRNEMEARQMTKQVDLVRYPLINVDGYTILAP